MAKYTQLSMEEREKIQLGLWEKKPLRTIALELGRSPSTLSRELRKNCPPGQLRYIPRAAHERARNRITARGQRPRLKSEFIRQYVQGKLREGWSPEQIAGRLSLEHPTCIVSHEAIYQYVYSQYHRAGYGRCVGDDLRIHLKRRHRVRHRKHIPYVVETGPLRNRISIDQRPQEVDSRMVPGHWEGDSMVSRQSPVRLNTLVERTSGLALITKLPDGTGLATRQSVVRRLLRIPRRLRKSITWDNGFENSQHEKITETLGTDCYFAHPYHSWERGTNENTNGLIRWYLPKGTDLAMIPEKTVRVIEQRLNSRPRKRLDWRTPLEVFNSFVLR